MGIVSTVATMQQAQAHVRRATWFLVNPAALYPSAAEVRAPSDVRAAFLLILHAGTFWLRYPRVPRRALESHPYMFDYSTAARGSDDRRSLSYSSNSASKC